jgi:3-oxoacid CoA-transferase
MVGGYGKLGAPLSLISALASSPAKNLTIVCGIASCSERGSAIQELIEAKKVSRLITSSVGENQLILDQFKKGELAVEILPMGTLAEKARSGGFGIPGFYSSVGIGTFHEEGGLPVKYSKEGVITDVNLPLEKREFHGRDCLFERTFLGDYALIKAWKADNKGNCLLNLAARNFNPDMACAGKICIAEAEEIVEPGQLDGDDIHISGIFVHRVVKAASKEPNYADNGTCPIGNDKKKEAIVKRAAQEIKNGQYVILGCGLPKAIERFISESIDVHYFYPETGVFGGIRKGKHQANVTDRCMLPLGLRKNAAIVKASDGFCALRGSHINNIFVEAYQVSASGDLANIEKGDRILPSVGANMDLTSPGPRSALVALMELETNGKCNLLKQCTYRLSGKNCVSKLITDVGVFEFKKDGVHLTEIAAGVNADTVKGKVPFELKVANDLKNMTG